MRLLYRRTRAGRNRKSSQAQNGGVNACRSVDYFVYSIKLKRPRMVIWLSFSLGGKTNFQSGTGSKFRKRIPEHLREILHFIVLYLHSLVFKRPLHCRRRIKMMFAREKSRAVNHAVSRHSLGTAIQRPSHQTCTGF